MIEIRCSVPSPNPNSQVIGNAKSARIGQEVTYTCNPGYHITGLVDATTKTIRCTNRNNRGVWNGQTPTCEGKTTL